MKKPENFLFYQTRKELPVIKKAEGIYMWDHNGREYIDGCSGAVISNIGYGSKRIQETIASQAQETFFAYRIHFENQPALNLAEKLAKASAPHLNRVFFVSGGSEAVESAMKICRQYFFNTGQGGRHLFISRRPSYHGCTLGALGITSYAPLEAPFKAIVNTHPKIPAPFCYRCAYDMTYPACNLKCAHALEQCILDNGPDNVAAFVAEPIGGASTGAVVPPEDYFSVIEGICRKYGIMLILDEVMTGFGRTGALFGYEHWQTKADIVALSKGMAAGYFPLGAAVTTEKIVNSILDSGGFAHGHTYAGNPMACAVGEEVLDIILENRLPENAAATGSHLKKGLEALKDTHEIIGDVRGRGLLLAIELVKNRETREPFRADGNANLALADAAFEKGLIIYPRKPLNGLAGDHLLVAPPLITTKAQADVILDRLDQALLQIRGRL
ncbi:MAG TPA: aspartate aminotransferase family protein [Desulfobacteraceae bacterium]|nr:aspartate aminotransferase family protein [Desulfobacteraceae bacterium]